MADPVTGSGGTCKIGPTGSAVTINKITTWTYSSEKDTEERGPYVGDPNKVQINAGKTTTMEFECDVPTGGDAGQDDVLDAYDNDTHPQLVFTTDGGKVVTFATPFYQSAEIALDAAGTQTMTFSVSGTATVTQDT